MRTRLAQALSLIGAVTVLVLAANTVALAADGKGFLLGRTNKASQVTILQRTTTGPALSLRATGGPPLAVNSSVKVKNLNADTLDGKSSEAFASAGVKNTVTKLGTTVNGVKNSVTELGTELSALENKVTAAGPLTPIAAGYITETGTVIHAHGIGAVGYLGNGAYRVEIIGEDYFYTDYVPMVTPECSRVTVDASSSGGYFYVAFKDAATGNGTACAFALSIIKPPN
ncbi:MAG TPA: hypothetical protein VF426_00300 [Marmoricola sp.]